MQSFQRILRRHNDPDSRLMWCYPYLFLSTLYCYAIYSNGLFGMLHNKGVSEEFNEVEKTLKIKVWEF